MADDILLQPLTPVGRIRVSPVIKVWKYKERSKKRVYNAYKKRKRKKRKHLIDIYA